MGRGKRTFSVISLGGRVGGEGKNIDELGEKRYEYNFFIDEHSKRVSGTREKTVSLPSL